MDRREKRLGMGNLVKSPVKSKDKGSFARFWKLRWFVLAEVIFVDADDEIQESKLVLSYYKDKESHEKDEQPKGTLNISQCISIKSSFQPVANFNHIFTIEFNDGRIVRFSAASCEKKSKWLSLLYKYRFNGNIENIMRTFGISAASANDTPSGHNRSSICSNGRSGSLKARSRNGRDSGRFSLSGPILGEDAQEEPPPLPPRRQSTLSEISHMADELDTSLSSSTRPAVNENEIDLNMLQIFNDLFMLCSKCQSEAQRKSSFSRKKRSSKIWDNRQEDVEVRQESTQKAQKPTEDDAMSVFSNNSDEFFIEDPFYPYTKIDEILLEKVKELQQKSADEEITDIKEEQRENEGCRTNVFDTEIMQGEKEGLKNDTEDDEEYMAMNIAQENANALLAVGMEPPLGNGACLANEVESDAHISDGGKDTCGGAHEKGEPGYDDKMKKVFEMNF